VAVRIYGLVLCVCVVMLAFSWLPRNSIRVAGIQVPLLWSSRTEAAVQTDDTCAACTEEGVGFTTGANQQLALPPHLEERLANLQWEVSQQTWLASQSGVSSVSRQLDATGSQVDLPCPERYEIGSAMGSSRMQEWSQQTGLALQSEVSSVSRQLDTTGSLFDLPCPERHELGSALGTRMLSSDESFDLGTAASSGDAHFLWSSGRTLVSRGTSL